MVQLNQGQYFSTPCLQILFLYEPYTWKKLKLPYRLCYRISSYVKGSLPPRTIKMLYLVCMFWLFDELLQILKVKNELWKKATWN